MPSKNIRQRRLMGMALREKRGGSTGSPTAKKISRTMSEGQLRDFASNTKVGRAKRKARRATRRSYRT